MSCFITAAESMAECINAILYGVALTDAEQESKDELYDLAKSYIEIYDESKQQ